ncbi:MAG: hypothetical protein AAF902_15010 [Chloroflexota bacterium]
MQLACRKFFLFGALILPILGCTLPNFAALAPDPSPASEQNEAAAAIVPTVEAQTEVGESTTEPIGPPTVPERVSELPAVSVPSFEPPDLFTLQAGQTYLINQSAQFQFQPTSGRPVVIRLTNDAALQFPQDLSPTVQIQRSDSQTTYLIVASVSPLNFAIAELTQAAQLSVVELDSSQAKVVDTADFVGPSELRRTELILNENATYVVILQPDATLDGVVELYDTAGIRDSRDEGGVGEAEILVFSAPQAAEWALVTYSFLDSAGSYTLEVYEIR